MQKLIEAVQARLGEGYKVDQAEVVRRNDRRLQSITITNGEGLGTVFYPHLKDDADIDAEADALVAAYRRMKTPDAEHLFDDMDAFLAGVRVCPCSVAKNTEWLTDVPYKPLNDLALYVRYFIDEEKSVKVNGSLLAMIGLDFDTVYARAVQNTCDRTKVSSLAIVIAQMAAEMGLPEEYASDIADDSSLVILTNDTGVFGAGSIVNTAMLTTIAKHNNADKLAIFPSSIHELLVMPLNDIEYMDTEDLRDMVTTINTDVVNDDDVLADSVYLYDVETEQITVM